MYCFFFNDTATTEIYTLSLHDALPIFEAQSSVLEPRGEHPDIVDLRLCAILEAPRHAHLELPRQVGVLAVARDRKSTRLNSSHANISYAVFCLKKKKNNTINEVKVFTV